MSSEQPQTYREIPLSERGDSMTITFGPDYARARHENFEEPYEFVLDEDGCERNPLVDAKKRDAILKGKVNVRPALYRAVVRLHEEEQEQEEAKRNRKRTCLRNLAQAFVEDDVYETKTPSQD